MGDATRLSHSDESSDDRGPLLGVPFVREGFHDELAYQDAEKARAQAQAGWVAGVQRLRRSRPLLCAALVGVPLVALLLLLARHLAAPGRPSDGLLDEFHGAASELQTSRLGHAPVTEITGERPKQDAGVGINLHPYDHVFRGPRYNLVKWRVTTGERRPDGVRKKVYLINDQFPGPTIESRQGDILIVEVTNELRDEGVSIHWHGLHMVGYQKMDGAVGITQDPIKPGQRFTYRFQVPYDQRGTFWYHAHDELQRADGLYGGLVIHSPDKNSRDGANSHGFGEFVREQLVMVGDWYHQQAAQVMDYYMSMDSFGNEPVPDSVVVNGRGDYDCKSAVPARPVDCVRASAPPQLYIPIPGRYRFRLVNTGLLSGFSVDFGDNNATLVSIDGGNWVNRTWGHAVGVLYPGERADVLVDWHASEGFLNLTLDDSSYRYSNPALSPTYLLPVHYDEAMERQPGHNPNLTAKTIDMANVTSHREAPRPAKKADKVLVLYSNTEKLAHLANVPSSSINHTSWRPQSPPLIELPRKQYDRHQFIPYIHSPARDPVWVDLVINNLDDGPHPFHLHGYHFFLLQRSAGTSYWGSWNPFRDPSPPAGPLNVLDPPRKDTVLVPSKGYVVLRFKADNYGKWLMHCHVLWHLAGGMGMAIEVGRDALGLEDEGTGMGGVVGFPERQEQEGEEKRGKAGDAFAGVVAERV